MLTVESLSYFLVAPCHHLLRNETQKLPGNGCWNGWGGYLRLGKSKAEIDITNTTEGGRVAQGRDLIRDALEGSPTKDVRRDD